MGMAAGQARLLSITSRMSDNELRAQIINNNKMRLATESSQASEAYIAALNQAQLMFTNYDADNVATYQKLTHKALTSFNPYNNQYALINSSGNVLLSEVDAENYKNSHGDLKTFLGFYGLEQTTTYFEQFGSGVTFDGFEGLELGTDALKDLFEGGKKLTIGKLQNVDVENYDLAFSSDTRYNYEFALAEYITAKENYLSLIAGSMEEKFEGFVANAGFGKMGTSGAITTTDDNALKTISDLTAYIKSITTDSAVEGYVTEANAKTYLKAIMEKIYKSVTPATGLVSQMSDNGLTGGSDTATSYFVQIQSTINKNKVNFAIEEYSNNLTYVTDGSGNLFIASTNTNGSIEDIVCCVRSDNTIGFYDENAGRFGNDTTNTEYTYQNKSNPSDSQGFYVIGVPTTASNNTITYNRTDGIYPGNTTSKGWQKDPSDTAGKSITLRAAVAANTTTGTAAVAEDKRTFYKVVTNDTDKKPIAVPNFDVYSPNDVDNMKNVVISVLESLQDSIYSVWNVTSSQFTSADRYDAGSLSDEAWSTYNREHGTNYDKATVAQKLNQIAAGKIGEAKNTYEDKAEALGKIIYGDNYGNSTFGTPNMDSLDQLGELYKGYDNTHPFGDKFKNIFGSLLLDMVFDTYGEPKVAWIDSTLPRDSYNTNGDAKARWYENLFNRIQTGGYKVLQDGLASSPEWIEFAFESGIVTMEQVDSNNAWNPLIYSNCSDITSQTDDKAVALAEAEYKAAMNRIENKDKRYDLELKNIDTEHNSLQVEYDSIKAAIDKNIERTFKLYS